MSAAAVVVFFFFMNDLSVGATKRIKGESEKR